MNEAKIRAQLLLPDDLCSFATVSEFEERLDQRLLAADAGEVTGGGIGSGWYRFDLVLVDFRRTAALLTRWADDLGLPEGTCLRRAGSDEVTVIVAAE